MASATLSALAGGLAVATYLALAKVYDELAGARRREGELKLRLAEIRVRQERTRIARDLHDGVGAELAALAWRLRTLALDARPSDEGAFLALERRVVKASDELRDVVVALRIEPASFRDAITLLSERCSEVCAGIELCFRVECASDRAPSQMPPDVPLIVLELVRNAARHADARRVEVRIRVAEELSLCVTDDGHGLDSLASTRTNGGLVNVHRRVVGLSGRTLIHSNEAGTRIEISVPLSGPTSVARKSAALRA
jgi:signal transduction histidine kinase